MKSLFLKIKFLRECKTFPTSNGMTYVELIVVLSIFSVLSSVAIFNYGGFQDKVDIRNLASDVASKIVEAQKASLSGLLPPLVQQGLIDSSWKPSYGVYFSLASSKGADNKNFIYFVDLGNGTPRDYLFDGSTCPGGNECLSKITITKNNYISRLDVFYQDGTSSTSGPSLNDLTLTFSRPNSGAAIFSDGVQVSNVSYVQITVSSSRETKAYIKLYASGRIEAK